MQFGSCTRSHSQPLVLWVEWQVPGGCCTQQQAQAQEEAQAQPQIVRLTSERLQQAGQIAYLLPSRRVGEADNQWPTFFSIEISCLMHCTLNAHISLI